MGTVARSTTRHTAAAKHRFQEQRRARMRQRVLDHSRFATGTDKPTKAQVRKNELSTRELQDVLDGLNNPQHAKRIKPPRRQLRAAQPMVAPAAVSRVSRPTAVAQAAKAARGISDRLIARACPGGDLELRSRSSSSGMVSLSGFPLR